MHIRARADQQDAHDDRRRRLTRHSAARLRAGVRAKEEAPVQGAVLYNGKLNLSKTLSATHRKVCFLKLKDFIIQTVKYFLNSLKIKECFEKVSVQQKGYKPNLIKNV